MERKQCHQGVTRIGLHLSFIRMQNIHHLSFIMAVLLLLKVTLNIQNVRLSRGQFPQAHKKDRRKEKEQFSVLLKYFLAVGENENRAGRLLINILLGQTFLFGSPCKMDLLKVFSICNKLSVYLPSFLTHSTQWSAMKSIIWQESETFRFRGIHFIALDFSQVHLCGGWQFCVRESFYNPWTFHAISSSEHKLSCF